MFIARLTFVLRRVSPVSFFCSLVGSSHGLLYVYSVLFCFCMTNRDFKGAAVGPGGVIYGAITTLLVGQYISLRDMRTAI